MGTLFRRVTAKETVKWSLEGIANDGDNFTNVSNTEKDEKIEINASEGDANTAVLTIPAKAYLTGQNVITAAVVAKSTTDDTKAARFYVNIALTEKVTGVKITGSETIQAPDGKDSDGNPNKVVAAYTAALAGLHVKADTAVTWTTDPETLPEGVTVSGTGNTKNVQVTSEVETASTIKLKATSGDKNDEVTITITPNKDIDAGTTISLASAEGAEWDGTADATSGTNGTLTINARTMESVEVPLTIESEIRDASALTAPDDFTVSKLTVKGQDGAPDTYMELSGVTVKRETSGKNKGKLYLVIDKTAPEILAASAGTTEDGVITGKVDATVCKLEVKMPAKAGTAQAAKTVEFKFNIVINQYMKGIEFYTFENDAESKVDDNIFTVTKSGSDDITVDLSKSKVIGAHLKASGDDQKIEYVIISKENKSKSTITDGVLTIAAGGAQDRIIRVKATAVNDKHTPKASNVLTIKVTD